MDPDGDAVTFKWWQYYEADTYAGQIAIDGADTRDASFVVPADAKPGDTIHVILEVKDAGTPALTRYQRVVVTVGTPVLGRRRRHGAGDAVADARRAGDVRRVHAGRGARVHGDDDGERDLAPPVTRR